MSVSSVNKNSDVSVHDQLLKIMRDYIAESSPGRRLPSENALCNKYKIARMTVSKVLNQLEQEGKIQRRRGSGSFVAACPVFTFFLPCDNFLSHTDTSTHTVRLLMKGAIKATRELNIKFETVVASHTNDPEDVDLSCLSHINSQSMVLISNWFFSLFKPLYDLQAKVCLHHSQDIQYGYRQYTNNWIKFERDRKSAIRKIISILRQQGHKKIALIAPWIISEKKHPVFTAYCEEMLKANIEPIAFELPPYDDIPRDELEQFYERHHFDAAIIGLSVSIYQDTVNSYLGFPEHVAVFGMNYSKELFHFSKPIPYCLTQFEQLGYDAVKLLMDEKSRGITKVYEYEFFEQ